VEGGNENDYIYPPDPINGFDLDVVVGFSAIRSNGADRRVTPRTYGPKYFCGNVGCISYQSSPGTNYTQWGLFVYNGNFGIGVSMCS
jgi:hypothetical protein